MPILRFRRPAMATLFEAWLEGPDPFHLEAAGECLLEEVVRVERLLSRHDRAGELYRVNQEARSRPVRVCEELRQILVDCLAWHTRTAGAFNPVVACIPGGSGDWSSLRQVLRLDQDGRTVRLESAHLGLDLGAYGKGYALDVAAAQLVDLGIESAFLHGGTSSVRALSLGRRWRIDLADPFQPGGPAVGSVSLTSGGLSTSSVARPGERSDLIDPETGNPLDRGAACTVRAATATEAEVLSTALLVMGRDRARAFAREKLGREVDVAWIDQDEGGQVRLEWWAGGDSE